MTIASWCATAAAALAAIAALVSSLDGDVLELRFFLAATVVAAIQAWAVTSPHRRMLAIGIGVTALMVAAGIDGLLVLARGSGPDFPAPVVEATYLGLTATVYRLVALHAGAILVWIAALLPDRPDIVFLHPRRDLRAVYGAASARASGAGVDSLDLLDAALASALVATLLREQGIDPSVAKAVAAHARTSREPSPGLTDDARRVIETVSRWAVERRREPGSGDLLLALAAVDTPARVVLRSLGLDAAAIRQLVD
jgi:hypothetical protein